MLRRLTNRRFIIIIADTDQPYWSLNASLFLGLFLFTLFNRTRVGAATTLAAKIYKALIITTIIMCRRSGVYLGNSYGNSTGQIWLNYLQCNGSETSFINCLHSGWGVHYCNHHKDVSIRCLTGTFFDTFAFCLAGLISPSIFAMLCLTKINDPSVVIVIRRKALFVV